MAKAITITKREFEDFILPLGFMEIQLPGTHELVYAKVIWNGKEKLSLRVYTSIDKYGISRRNGGDSMKVAVVRRNERGAIFPVGSDRRVHRVEGWRRNLLQRIEAAQLKYSRNETQSTLQAS